MTFKEILPYFQGVRMAGSNKAMCKCPAHYDEKQSLSIEDNGSGKILLHCFAGCQTGEIALAAGLQMKDLYYGDMASKPPWMKYVESVKKKSIEAYYNYTTISGQYAYTKVRMQGKDMVFGILSGDRFTFGLAGRNRREYKAIFGSSPAKIREAVSRGEYIFYAEGEKDVNTLLLYGYTAFTCGGANDWNKAVLEVLTGARVIILADNDEPGKDSACSIYRDMKEADVTAKILLPVADVPHADVTDYFQAGHTAQDFDKLIQGDDTKKILKRGKANSKTDESEQLFKPLIAASARDLEQMDVPPVVWIVDNLLPIGVSMIGAPSKYFKSYMALGLCLAVCTGKKFLDHQCNKFSCLYLDLESTKRRPKSRLKQILPGGNWPGNFYILTAEDEIKRLGEGFSEQIEEQLKQHPDIKLVIVDVFQMIRQPAKKNQSGYDRDYDDFKILKKIANSHEIGLMLIHHTRKMKDPGDVFNELSGSVGVMGALDCAWVITKDRYSEEGTLNITGRDMESQRLKIRFNKTSFMWEYVGTEEDVNNQRRLAIFCNNPIRETIKKLVEQGNGHWEGSATEIKEASKYLSWEIYEDVKKIGKFIRENDDLFQGIDGINPVASRTSSNKRWVFNGTNGTNGTDVTNGTNGTDV